MPRPLLVSPSAGPRHTVAVMGDSLSHNITLGVPPHMLWPVVLAANLRADGYRAKARNYAVSGNTTTQMLVRFAVMTRIDVPKLGVIFGGVNDPGSSINQATTQANIEAMIQALIDAGTRYVVVVSPQFLNYTSGGESTSQTKSSGLYTQVYDAQVAAVASKAAAYPGRVAFCDLWNWMKALIVGGTVHGVTIPVTDTLASASWHVAGTNQHLNTYGQSIVATVVRACIAAQDGGSWLDALREN